MAKEPGQIAWSAAANNSSTWIGVDWNYLNYTQKEMWARVEAAEARIAELTGALERFAKLEKDITADVKTAHQNRGNGASEWMSEEDGEMRRDLRAAFDAARAALAKGGDNE